MTSRKWSCPTCGAQYTLEPSGDDPGPQKPSPSPSGEGGITEQQRKAIYAISRDLPGGEERIKNIMAESYQVDKVDQLTKTQASALISRLNKAKFDTL